ncbi:MAG: VCBS repeat-containing protein [Flavobacteriaceae bacterium]
MKPLAYAIVVFLLLSTSCKNKDQKNLNLTKDSNAKIVNEPEVFKRIKASSSGLVFSNTIKENVATLENLFDDDYFYNGAGVGVADLNNDGLLDVVFTANQVQNKVFLNLGNLKFKDITKTANINKGKNWSNGVTFADVNNDGWIDIYISQGGPKKRTERKNLLFINNKDLTFTESAAKYGLADVGISTQSAFFDYDKDGDLDCIVMNENSLYGVDPYNFNRYLRKDKELLFNSSSHFYKNINGHFKEVTEQVGMLRATFGLGLTISDINNDGWQDIYITNDYYVPDAIYLNNKKGGFTESAKKLVKQVSFYGMGVDIADINNDLRQDIFVLDMAAADHYRSKTLMASMNTKRFDYLVKTENYAYQYMYNSLQLNIGNNTFNNVVQLAKVGKTDWSWAGLLADYNNDGYKDIYVTNGYRKYGSDNDLKIKINKIKRQYKGDVPLKVKQQLYDEMISGKLPNIMFKNKTHLKFENKASEWGLSDPSFSNGAVYADLDNDGDLELLVNNMDDNAFLYKNLSVENKLGNYINVKTIGETSEPFAKVTISYKGGKQLIETKRVKGYRSATENTAHFGLGDVTKVDVVTVVWPNGKMEQKRNVKANTKLVFYSKNAVKRALKPKVKTLFKNINPSALNLNFTHKENPFNDFKVEILLPYKQSTLGPCVVKADVNGDGLTDIFVGGASYQASQIYVQTAKGFKLTSQKALQEDAINEDLDALFFDFDGDKDLDLYVVSGGSAYRSGSNNYIDRLYKNDGKGNFTHAKSSEIDKNRFSGKSVTAIDYDKDGDLDLIIGNRMEPFNYPRAQRSIIYQNNNGSFTDVTSKVAPDFLDFGAVDKVITTDINNDGWQDFIAVGEWSGIGIYVNEKGTFKNISSKSGLDKEKGWWFTVAETDVNNDGFKDYIVGNVGLNYKYKASRAKPFKVFANDFDTNGTNDIILSSKYKGEYVPARGKECSTQQMSFISEKFKTYSSYANATVLDIYGDDLNNSYEKEVSEFKSIVLINNKDATFTKHYLPVMAQTIPILDCAFTDVNNDGFEDVILVGNIYDTEVETPRLDNTSGIVLLSNKKDNYTFIDRTETGLYLNGDVKVIEKVKFGSEYIYIVGKNNAKLSVFK